MVRTVIAQYDEEAFFAGKQWLYVASKNQEGLEAPGAKRMSVVSNGLNSFDGYEFSAALNRTPKWLQSFIYIGL